MINVLVDGATFTLRGDGSTIMHQPGIPAPLTTVVDGKCHSIQPAKKGDSCAGAHLTEKCAVGMSFHLSCIGETHGSSSTTSSTKAKLPVKIDTHRGG